MLRYFIPGSCCGLILLLGACASLGERVPVGKQASGGWSRLPRPFASILSSEKAWKELQGKMFDGVKDAPADPTPAFEREILLLVSAGNHGASRGLRTLEVWEDEERLLVRMQHDYFGYSQDPGGPVEAITRPTAKESWRPYGMLLLPHRKGKRIVVEIDTQHVKLAPPVWTPLYRFCAGLEPEGR